MVTLNFDILTLRMFGSKRDVFSELLARAFHLPDLKLKKILYLEATQTVPPRPGLVKISYV